MVVFVSHSGAVQRRRKKRRTEMEANSSLASEKSPRPPSTQSENRKDNGVLHAFLPFLLHSIAMLS